MGYKFDIEQQKYVFEPLDSNSTDGIEDILFEEVKLESNTLPSKDIVYNVMESLIRSDVTFNEIQADKSVKEISLNGDKVVEYLSGNRLTFEEAGRNATAAANHLIAYCIKNGASVDDLVHYANNPDDARGKEIDKIVKQSRKEFFETTCCKDKELAHQKAGEFYAGYIKNYVTQMDEIRKLPQENNKDIDYLQVIATNQQSILEQTVKEANRDIITKANDILAKENYPLTFENIEYSIGLTSRITQESRQFTIEDDMPPVKVQSLAQHYNSFKALADSFRKEYSAEKGIFDIFQPYDAEKYMEVTENPYGVEDPKKYDESYADNPEAFASTLDYILDKKYHEMGEGQIYEDPDKELDKYISNLSPSDNEKFRDIIDAADSLRVILSTSNDTLQHEAGYRQLQYKAAIYLASAEDSPEKQMAEQVFRYAGAEKLAVKGAAYGFVQVGENTYDQKEVNKDYEINLHSNMAASQKKIYGKSSAEFTTLENTLKEYNELLASAGDNPTPEQSVKLYEYSKKIQSDAKKYLDLKEGKKLTANGKERYQLVKDINSHFAKREKDLFVQTIDAKYAEFVKNPSTKYVRVTDSGFVKMTLETVLKASDNFACMQAIEQLGVRDAVNVAATLNTAKTKEEFDAIIADKHSGIDVSSVDVIKANADFIFACSQKDRNELSQRQANAREILDNVKFPEPDREAYEQTAKANGIQIKDASGDAQYLANTQLILDTQKNLTLQYYGQMAPNTPRWAQTLYCKPGITEEEKAIIFEGVTNPKAAGKLYDFAFKELASINIDEMFKEKSMDEYAKSFEKESYLRLLAWDCTNMFISVDNSIEKGDYVIDKTVYEQTKNYAHTISKNASNINTRIDQYQRPQSMVMDLAGKAEDTMKLMAAPDLSEADRNFAVLQMTANNPDDPIQDLEFAKQKYDFTTSCHENAMKHLGKANEAFLKFKQAVETKAKDTALKANDFVQECAETIYYNMAKLEVNSFTKAGMENYLQPNVKEEKVGLLRNTFIQMIPNMKMDEIEELLHRTEPDPERVQTFRDQLGITIKDKAAEKEAQKDVQKKAPEAPKKEAPQGKVL